MEYPILEVQQLPVMVIMTVLLQSIILMAICCGCKVLEAVVMKLFIVLTLMIMNTFILQEYLQITQTLEVIA